MWTRIRNENERPSRLAAFAGVRRQLEELGYTCIEVPLLLLDPQQNDVPLTLSYANVVQEERDGQKTVYLPTYRVLRLDDAALETWRGLGYRVVPIDALGPAMRGGAIRCLSQVLRAPGPLRSKRP